MFTMSLVGLGRGFPDGTSNTIAVAEHLAIGCGGVGFSWLMISGSFFPKNPPIVTANGVLRQRRGGTFADVDLDDLLPENPLPSLTFQVRPVGDQCDPRIPQTYHVSGMNVGLADGSVRGLSRGMSPGTFWAAVTPGGGEVLGADC
jgi:prepilin-type processing-associated H-X9-DG protein